MLPGNDNPAIPTRALVVCYHPSLESFNAAIRDFMLAKPCAAGAEVRLTDLYAKGLTSGADPAGMARLSGLP